MNSAAQLTGDQFKALVIAYRDIFESKDAANIPVEDFQVDVSFSGHDYDVGFYLKRHGALTGGGVAEIIGLDDYRIKERRSYCPGRPVSTRLPPC